MNGASLSAALTRDRDQTAQARPRASGVRIPELDGLRGIAILMVLIFHLFGYSMFKKTWAGVAHWIMLPTWQGARGVDLFFVLSGFLITGILLSTRADPNYFRNFYARRALRILPLYYAVLLVILLCYRNSSDYVLVSFFYLSNVAPLVGITMVNGAMWSLSVEEHFYLFWPLLIRSLPLRAVAPAALVICLSEPVSRGLAFSHGANVFPYTWFRLDGLAAGALIACFVSSSRYSVRNANGLAIALLCAGLLLQIGGAPFGIHRQHVLFAAIWQFPAANLLSAAAVLWAVAMSGQSQTSILRIWPLRLCGELSYCLYLIHCMVMDGYDAALHALRQPPAITNFQGILIRAAAVLAVCFAVAVISRNVIERPALRLKRFFEPSAI
jgi:peptidoglycan/LPS O-acetylase OafA/YrhL